MTLSAGLARHKAELEHSLHRGESVLGRLEPADERHPKLIRFCADLRRMLAETNTAIDEIEEDVGHV